MEGFDIGSLLQSVLPGVAAIATRKPSAVMNTIGSIQQGQAFGEKQSETARMKAFGLDAIKLGTNASPEAILQLAVKHKVNPATAVQYMNAFSQWRRGGKDDKLLDLKISEAERGSAEAIAKAERDKAQMGARSTFLNTLMGGGTTPGGMPPEAPTGGAPDIKSLMGMGVSGGFKGDEVWDILGSVGIEKPTKKEKAKLQKIETVNAEGKPVVKYLPEDQVIGQEFPVYKEPKTAKDTEKDDVEIRMKKLNAFAKLRGFAEFSKLDEKTSTKVVQDLINYQTLTTAGEDPIDSMKKAREQTDGQFEKDAELSKLSKMPTGLLSNYALIDKIKETLSKQLATPDEIKAVLMQKGLSEADANAVIAKAQGTAATQIPAAPAAPNMTADPLGIR